MDLAEIWILDSEDADRELEMGGGLRFLATDICVYSKGLFRWDPRLDSFIVGWWQDSLKVYTMMVG